MKKSLLGLSIVSAAALAVAQSASASLLAYEPFDYTAGQTIDGQANPSTGTSWTGAIGSQTSAPGNVVNAGSLTSPSGFPASTGNSGDFVNQPTNVAEGHAAGKDLVKLRFGGLHSFAENTTLYYSTLLKIPDLTSLTIGSTNNAANNDPIIMLGAENSGGTDLGANWAGELVIRLGSATGTYNLGIRASITSGTQYWTGDIPADNSTHLVVVRFDQGASSSTAADCSNSLWLDPNSASFGLGVAPAPDGSTLGVTSSSATNPINGIEAGAYNANNTQPNHWYLDEIRVGTTWADVTSVAAVPEPTTISLAGIGALGMLARRRRTA